MSDSAAPAFSGNVVAEVIDNGQISGHRIHGSSCCRGKVYPTENRSTGIGWAIGLGRSGAVVGAAAAGFLIAAGFSMSTNYYVFAGPMALGGLISYWLKVK